MYFRVYTLISVPFPSPPLFFPPIFSVYWIFIASLREIICLWLSPCDLLTGKPVTLAPHFWDPWGRFVLLFVRAEYFLLFSVI